MIVSKILILFLPLLLLAEANLGIGPFHRSPPASIPSGSSTSLNLPANQRIPSPPKLPHHNRHTPPSVHVGPVTLVPKQKSVSVEPATLPPKIDTDLQIEIQTPKPGLVQPRTLHTDDANWNNNSYRVSKPVLSRWSQPKFPSPSVNQPNTPLLVHVKPITPVTSKQSVTVDPAILPPKKDTDSKIRIHTPGSEVIQKPDLFRTENINQDISSYYVPKPASSPWSPPKLKTPSLNIQTVSQPNIVESVHAEPVVTPEKSVSVDPSNLSPKIYTDSPIEILKSKPGVVQSSHPFHADNMHRDTRPYHVPRPVQSPWTPLKLQTPSLNIQTVSQPNIVESVHVEPAIVVTPEKSDNIQRPAQPNTHPSIHVAPLSPVTTEKTISVDPAPFPPKIITDSPIEIKTPIQPVYQKPHPFHKENINQNTSSYYISRPASNPWSPPKFPAPSLNIHTVSQPNKMESVHTALVIVVTPAKSDSEEPATLPPKIDTDSPIEIQTPKPGLVQPTNAFHKDTINQNTSPYNHVPKPVVSSRSQPKFPSPSVNIHKPSVPDIVESVHVEPVTVVTPEKSVSVDPSNLLPKIDTDSPIEIQKSKAGVVQPSHPFHVDNIHRDTSPYHAPRPVQSPWTPPKLQTPSVNIQTVSQLKKSVSMDSATLPIVIDADSHIEIQTPKPGLVQPPHRRMESHINNINWVNGPYRVPKPASNPWTPPKFDTVQSVNIHRASQPNTLPFGQLSHASYAYSTPPTVSPVPTNKTLVQDVSVDPSSDLNKFSTNELELEIQTTETSNSIPRPAPSPRIPTKPSTNSSEVILSASQPMYTDKGTRKDIGPFHRSQRSADTWDQNTWEEDQISQNNPPPALSTERPGSNLRRFMCPQAYGYFKYTKKCSEYIECKNYKPLLYTCPAGLYFNPRAKWTEYPCDHPSNVQCDKEAIPQPTTASPPTTTLPPKVVSTPRPNNQKKHNYKCPQRYGYFKFNDKCEQYIECKNYVALMFSCPAGLHFNPRVEWTAYPCDLPSVVQCDSEPNDEKTPKPTEAPTTTTVQPTPSTRPPPPTTPSTRPPPPTTRSPPPRLTRRQPPPPPTITWRQRPPTTRPTPSTTRQPPPSTTRSPPPPSTTMSPTPPPTTSPLPVITPGPKNPPDYNLCPQQFGYFKFSDQCGEYLECKNYVPLIFTCPAGLHFNPLADWTEYPCDLPSKVKCIEESVDPKVPSTTQPPPATTTQSPIVTTPQPGSKLLDFECPEAHGYFEYNDRCSEFIECKNYVPLAYTCPSGLQFNVLVHWPEYPCDYPSKVQCHKESGTKHPRESPNVSPSRPVVPPQPTIATPEPTVGTQSPTAVTPYLPRFPTQETEGPSTEQPSFELSDYYCHDPNAYYAVASQCDAYIECQGYRAMQRFCPASLHFDSKVQWPKFPCNYPSQVQCDKEPGQKQPPEHPNVTLRRTRPTVVTPRSIVVVTRSLPHFPIQGTVYRPTPSPSRPPVVPPRPTIATPAPTIITQSPTAVTPYIPRFPTQRTVYPPTPSPSRPPVVPPQPIAAPVPTAVTQSPTTVTPYLPRFPTQGTVRPSTERPSSELIDYYCREPNGYYAVASQCDSYVECKSNNATQHYCPAGLHFNPKAQWPNFPCEYPSIVQCKNDSVTDDPLARPQPIIATSPRPTGPVMTRIPREPTLKPSPSEQPFNFSCPESNGFYSVASQCDAYIECKDGNATEHTCPDGLLFNTNATWPDYPCSYPSEVTCSSEKIVQEANPTADCPHSHGFFPTDNGDCGEYKVCHAGVATIKHCPPGLVFNFDKLNTCDWPINVPACNQSRDLEGFVCPSPPDNENELHFHKYRYGRSCTNFVACQKGHPRLLSCDAGLHFKEETESCVDSDLVTDCDA